MRKSLGIGLIIIICGLSPVKVIGHPSIPSSLHPHNSNNVLWQTGPLTDGSLAHNHMVNTSFGGWNQRAREPYAAESCWDNHSYRYDLIGNFGKGHCFIDKSQGGNIVTYNIVGSMESDAADRVRDAFAAFNNLSTTYSISLVHGVTGNNVGIEFLEVPYTGDLTVLSADIGSNDYGGWIPAAKQMVFNSEIDWDYSYTSQTIDNSKYHFLSVALHEVGHAVGLSHQSDPGDIMNDQAGLAEPGPAGTRFVVYGVDADSKQGVYQLYGQPPPPPPPPPSPISWGNNNFVYCHLPQCALWDMRGNGGAGASSFEIKRSFSKYGSYTTIQTETNINYFNVHGGDKNMYWKICGINSGGETCSPDYRTRIECEIGGGPEW